MQKTEFITQSYFTARNDVRLKSAHYRIKKICNKRKLQNIATNHSTDISYKDFMKIYIKHTSKPYSFLTIVTKLSTNGRYVLEKISLFFYKLALADKIKSLHDKIKAIEPQYNLDRETAKIILM